MKTEANTAAADGNVQWENFVKFVRQLSHDLRNQLNAAELQSALIGELTNDAEIKSEIRRLRELVAQLGTTLQSLSASVAEPRPTPLPYAAKDFIADMQKKIAQEFPEKGQAVKWEVLPASGTLNIDPDWFIFSIREAKKEEIDPAQWMQPLHRVSQSHYGLGLRRARKIIAAQGGELNSKFDPASRTLTSTITLPYSTESP